MKAIFVSKQVEAEGVKSFVFKPEKRINFEAGQICEFYLPSGAMHHFTVSSSPLQENIEITTVLSGSAYKNELDSLQPGQAIEVQGPMGDFTLKRAGKKKIVFLAGGIGVTPARSMLSYLAGIKENRDFVLIYSNRTEQRIAFRQELEELQKKIFGLKIVLVVNELPDKRNSGIEKGIINAETIARNVPDFFGSVFFVCGPPAFVQAMEKMLNGLKLQKKQLVSENFSGY